MPPNLPVQKRVHLWCTLTRMPYMGAIHICHLRHRRQSEVVLHASPQRATLIQRGQVMIVAVRPNVKPVTSQSSSAICGCQVSVRFRASSVPAPRPEDTQSRIFYQVYILMSCSPQCCPMALDRTPTTLLFEGVRMRPTRLLQDKIIPTQQKMQYNAPHSVSMACRPN